METLRTLLFVPGHKEKFLDKAPQSGADGLLYDLEDSVPPAAREAARVATGSVVGAGPGLPSYVRINGMADAGKAEMEADLQAVVSEYLDGIVIPKVQTVEEVVFVSERLQTLEAEKRLAEGTIEIVPIIETALGVFNTFSIVSASQRVDSVVIATAEDGDLQADLGCEWSLDGIELHYARSRVVLEARAAGVGYPLDGVFLGLDDEEGLIRDSINARRLGYVGKTVIHPRQIDPVNRVFTPSEEVLEYYQDMIDAFELAKAQGNGAFNFRGKMIDVAMARKGQKLLDRFGSVP